MYCIQYNADKSYLESLIWDKDRQGGQATWTSQQQKVKLFSSEEEAIQYITRKNNKIFWLRHTFEVKYIHPLNIR